MQSILPQEIRMVQKFLFVGSIMHQKLGRFRAAALCGRHEGCESIRTDSSETITPGTEDACLAAIGELHSI